MADNTIAVRGNTDLMSFDDLASAFDAIQYNLPSSSSDPYLRMNKQGEWIYGAEDFEVEAGSKWAISPLSFQTGYVCWSRNDNPGTKNVKLGEIMGPANAPMPNKAALPDHGSPWAEQVSFLVVCVSGEDKGLQTKYATTSVGGINEVKQRLSKAVNAQLKAEKARGATAETAKIVPIVKLENSFYNHAQYKKIFTPVFTIVGWATLGDQDLPEEAKVAVKPEPKAEPEAEAEAPRRRTRRAA